MKNKGITLVALIITIIIMMILVGVTVSIVINSNLLGRAKQAGDELEAAYERDQNYGDNFQINIAGTMYNVLEYPNGGGETDNPDLAKLQAFYTAETPEAALAIIPDANTSIEVTDYYGNTIFITYNTKHYIVNQNTMNVTELPSSRFVFIGDGDGLDIIEYGADTTTWGEFIGSSYNSSYGFSIDDVNITKGSPWLLFYNGNLVETSDYLINGATYTWGAF